ncbi:MULTISPECIES: hypothetical protein [Sphingobium]|nr:MULTISPECIES: hypothetical protein [Sphingobium]MBT2246201.1 hypothetical protein [Sphingobium sp. BHU LFT2]PHP16279.1 hypothetical protein CG471_29020 [Sphingobium sp. IP1]RSU67689.1 hypothetical protein BRX37_25085 [Sphingomonas sp. S-NIH.Pt3_0716]ATI81053.1 hypothetical protein A6768_14400 [Sphingobium yanoikuyae]AYO77920.1 hypothetical protein EBF16_14165 [Sphingobium yanoikuyae]
MFKIMDWFPVVFILFKVVVLGAGMFFAVRWHYEQDRKAQKGAVLSAVGKISLALLLALVGLLSLTFMLARMLGMDMAL